MLLEELNGNIAPSRMVFKFAEFWVQIHNVPLLGMTVQTGRHIGNCMGECIDVAQGHEGECMGRYLRVCVKMDITKPLKQGTKISLSSGQNEWVDFRYEWLPDFYYNCGRVGHIMGDCTFVDEVVKNAKDKPYGSFLRVIHDFVKPRATSPKRARNWGMESGGNPKSSLQKVAQRGGSIEDEGVHDYYSGKEATMTKSVTAKLSKHKEDEELQQRKRLEAWETAQGGGRLNASKLQGMDKPLSPQNNRAGVAIDTLANHNKLKGKEKMGSSYNVLGDTFVTPIMAGVKANDLNGFPHDEPNKQLPKVTSNITLTMT